MGKGRHHPYPLRSTQLRRPRTRDSISPQAGSVTELPTVEEAFLRRPSGRSTLPPAVNELESHPQLQGCTKEVALAAIKDLAQEVATLRAQKEEAALTMETAQALYQMVERRTQDLRALHTELSSHVVCGICKGWMETPFSIVECGHSFCASCLAKWFRAEMQRKLDGFAFSFLEAEIRKTPTNVREALRLCKKVTWASELFTFSCPVCRQEVTVRPAKTGVGKGAVDYLRKAIQLPSLSMDVEEGGFGGGAVVRWTIQGKWSRMARRGCMDE